MKFKTLVITAMCLVLAVGLLMAACGGTTGSSSTTAAGGTTTTAPSGAGGAQVTLEIFQVKPETITLKVGQSVTFNNKDSAGHQMVGDKGEFDTGMLGQGDTYTFTPTAAGTIPYHCSVHPSMKGTITVE